MCCCVLKINGFGRKVALTEYLGAFVKGFILKASGYKIH
jgi:hypothetical protein